MKNNALKELIKQKANQVEISDRRNDILKNVISSKPEEETITKHKFINFYKLSPILFVLLLLVVSVVIYNQKKITPPSDGLKVKANQVLNCEILALSNAFNPTSENRLMKKDDSDSDDINEVALEINNYLYSSLVLFDKEKIISTVIENQDQFYQYQMLISYDETNYNIYYNETAKNPKKLYLAGVMEINDTNYKISGKKIFKKNKYEIELTIYNTNDDYLVVKKGLDSLDEEFSYEYYKNNNCYQEVNVQSKIQNDSKVIKISFKNNKNNRDYEIIESSENSFQCKYKDHNKSFEDGIIISYSDDDFLYIFSNGKQCSLKKKNNKK